MNKRVLTCAVVVTLAQPTVGDIVSTSGFFARGGASLLTETARPTSTLRNTRPQTPTDNPIFQTATFDFDTGTPTLVTGQNLPLDQMAGGVTAHFSSPTVGAGGFSVQSDASTQFHFSQFSGNYLYPNSVYNPALDIQFSQQLSSITFTFATADFQQVEVPTTIQLTAYENSTATLVGSTTAHGTYGSDTMPMGTLTFNSAMPFNLVEITIPYAPMAASGFLVDNITVTTTTRAPCIGDCNGDGQVTVDETLTMVSIALGDAGLSTCPPGDANPNSQILIDEILTAVNNALNGCFAH